MMKIIAITDETSTCECCGKTNLKKVIVMQTEDGSIVRYGTDCAAKAQGKKSAAVKVEVETAELAQRMLAKFTPELAIKALHNRGYMGAMLVNNTIVFKEVYGGKIWLEVQI